MNWQKSLRLLSLFLIVLGLVALGLTFFPVLKLEIEYKSAKVATSEIVPLNTELGIVIPKIGANSKIVAEVDPFDSKIYQQALTLGVAHAKNTPLPGDRGNSFLFSHSSVDFLKASQYNSVFYLLSKLEIGDPIYIYRNGQKIIFYVTQKQIVAADAIDYLNQNNAEPSLSLMTCWPPGTSLKRLMIVATKITD